MGDRGNKIRSRVTQIKAYFRIVLNINKKQKLTYFLIFFKRELKKLKTCFFQLREPWYNVVHTAPWTEQVIKTGLFFNLLCPKECELGSELKQLLLFKIWDLKVLHMKCKLEIIYTFFIVTPDSFDIYHLLPYPHSTQILHQHFSQRRRSACAGEGRKGGEDDGDSCLPFVTLSQQYANVPSCLAELYT